MSRAETLAAVLAETGDAVRAAARALLLTSDRPTSDSATARVNARALDNLRAALTAQEGERGERIEDARREALDEVLAVVEARHPEIAEPRHGCCATPKVCRGVHPPECGGKAHGINRPKWPCADLLAVREVRDRTTGQAT